MRLARVKYVVTSHDPFDPQQAARCLAPPPPPPRYRASLLLDKLFEQPDWAKVCARLEAAGEPCSLAGVASLLRRCCAAMQPASLSAATPHSFEYAAEASPSPLPEDVLLDQGTPPSAQQARDRPRPAPPAPPRSPPRAPHDALPHGDLGRPRPHLAAQVLECVVLPLCEERRLPLALRMGTRRAVNPALHLAGDGVGSAQLDALRQLCLANPAVKFMATVRPSP